MLLRFSVALTGLIIIMTIISPVVGKIDRHLAEIEWLFSANDQTTDG